MTSWQSKLVNRHEAVRKHLHETKLKKEFQSQSDPHHHPMYQPDSSRAQKLDDLMEVINEKKRNGMSPSVWHALTSHPDRSWTSKLNYWFPLHAMSPICRSERAKSITTSHIETLHEVRFRRWRAWHFAIGFTSFWDHSSYLFLHRTWLWL